MSIKKKSTISVAVSTMNGKALKNGFTSSQYFIIDQGENPSVNEHNIAYHFMVERGLSRSRNRAIDICNSTYLLFSDDDVQHLPGVFDAILDEFDQTGADILTFMIKTPDGSMFKPYQPSRFTHRNRSLFRVNSIEIAVRVDAIRRTNLRFDERFGLGADYPTGEEIIFLIDALRKGLDIRYVPLPIVIHPAESSGSALGNEKLIQAKGAMFARIFGFKGYIYSMLFSLRHHKKSKLGIIKFLSIIFLGGRNFMKTSKNFS